MAEVMSLDEHREAEAQQAKEEIAADMCQQFIDGLLDLPTLIQGLTILENAK